MYHHSDMFDECAVEAFSHAIMLGHVMDSDMVFRALRLEVLTEFVAVKTGSSLILSFRGSGGQDMV